MRTKQEYIDSIGRLKAEVYAFGSRVTGLYEHPCFRPAMRRSSGSWRCRGSPKRSS